MPTINTGNISLSDSDADWFRAMCAVDNNSTRAVLTQAVADYVRENREEYKQKIEYVARKYGLTISEAFNRLAQGEDLGEPLPRFEIDPLMEEELANTSSPES